MDKLDLARVVCSFLPDEAQMQRGWGVAVGVTWQRHY